jgi:glycosyltransferase involved in cell wall biosynthesis
VLDDAEMRIGYIWSRPLPSRDTDTQQVMKTIDALAAEGAEVDLILPESRHMRLIGMIAFEAELRAFYSLRSRLALRAVRGVEPSRIELERLVHALLSCLRIGGQGYDVIYTRSRSAAMLCALRGGPVVFETYRMLGADHPLLVRAYSKLASQPSMLGIVTHSDVARESIARLGFPPHKLATIHNGFDPADMQPQLTREQARAELGEDVAQPIALYTGHVRAAKGMDALLDMAALTPEVRYWVAGGHPHQVADLEAEITRRRLPHVRCLGWRPAAELRPLLYAADVLVIPPSALPLEQHGRTVLPMKVFGYLAAGRAILAPAIADLEEVLVHGENAWLVLPESPASAASALRMLIDDRALADRLGQGALRSAQGLTWRARARKMIDQIEQWKGRR